MEPIDLVPELDELASDWLDVADLAHMPSLHNFHQMAVCAPDLLGVHFWTRDSQMFVRDGPRFLEYRSLPPTPPADRGDGSRGRHRAAGCRIRPCARATVEAWEVTTVARLTFEESGLLYEIRCRNDADVRRELDLTIEVTGAVGHDGTTTVVWEDEVQDVLVTAAVDAPDKFDRSDWTTDMAWRPVVEPGAEFVVRLVQAEGPLTGEVIERARRYSSEFGRTWARTRRRLADALARRVHSREQPLLGQPPGARDRRRRRAPALLRRRPDPPRAPPHEPRPLRPGVRDQRRTGQGRRLLLGHIDVLPPVRAAGAPSHERATGRCSSRSTRTAERCSTSTAASSGAASTSRATPTATGTPRNDLSLFILAHDYVAVTGDQAFLGEMVGARTVDEHLRNLATAWRSLDTRGEGLADYGHVDNLLECVPSYVHEVVSLNAANVWMMRSMADGMDRTGDHAEAEVWRTRPIRSLRASWGATSPARGSGSWSTPTVPAGRSATATTSSAPLASCPIGWTTEPGRDARLRRA